MEEMNRPNSSRQCAASDADAAALQKKKRRSNVRLWIAVAQNDDAALAAALADGADENCANKKGDMAVHAVLQTRLSQVNKVTG